MARSFTRDSAGIAQILKSPEFAKAVDDIAQRVAAQVRSRKNVEVVVDRYTTDRAAASVTIRDVRGMIYHVRDRIFDAAAGSVGLEVNSR